MFPQGIRLQLLIGPELPVPAPFEVMASFLSLEVRQQARGRDVVQLDFSLGKAAIGGYNLLRTGLLDPPNRIIIAVLLNTVRTIIFDGLITHQQAAPSSDPGQSRLTVMGEDISIKMNLEEKKITHPDKSDSSIVKAILGNYDFLTVAVIETDEKPNKTERVPTQRGTDWAYIQALAQRNNHIFYVEPSGVPGQNRAYWGPEPRTGQPQPALNINMGPATNATISFGYDALAAAVPQAASGGADNAPLSVPASNLAALAAKPAAPLRSTIPGNIAGLNQIQAQLRALLAGSRGADAATGRGELDVMRYGRILQARRLVDVRSGSRKYDGTYYVKEVTHHIQRGEYRQSFGLAREGVGAAKDKVTTP